MTTGVYDAENNKYLAAKATTLLQQVKKRETSDLNTSEDTAVLQETTQQTN